MKPSKKIREYSIYLFAFLLPLQTQFILHQGKMAGSDWQYGTIGLYLTDIVLIAALFFFGVYYFKNKALNQEERLRISLFWWFLAGLDLFAFISIFMASDHGLAVYRYVVFLLAVGAAWVIIKAPFQKIKFVYFFALGLFFQALLGLGQFFFQYAPACKYLGLAEHDPQNLGVSVVETAGGNGLGGRWLRAYGGLDHPNVLAGALVVASLLILGVWVSRHFYRKKDLLIYFLFLVLVAGMFFTFSRAAWLGFVLGAGVLVMGYIITQKRVAAKRAGKMLGGALILVLVLGLIYNNIVVTRMTGETELEVKSTTQRVESLQESLRLIKAHPIFGVGIGNYTLALQEKYPDREVWSYQPVHNTFLLMAAEIGVIGTLFFLLVLFYLFRTSLEQRNILNLSILVSLVIMLMLDHWWWSLHFGVLFLGLVLGVVFKNLKAISKQPTGNSKLQNSNF